MESSSAALPEGDILYFAYGSCLNHASLSASLDLDVAPRFLGPAGLKGYRLSFSYASVTEAVCFATILPEAGARTEGGLFRLPTAVLPALDRREGVGSGRYARMPVTVETATGPQAALTYHGLVTLPFEARPSDRYRALFELGLRDCRLPEPWCRTILGHLDSLPHRDDLPTMQTLHRSSR